MPEDTVELRIHDPKLHPTLVYLPGLHGDWTIATPLAGALAGQLSLVTVTYPRTETWTLADYGAAVGRSLPAHGIHRAWILAESFGSQVAWQLFESTQTPHGFRAEGLILAGGFVRHPWPAAVRACARLLAVTPPVLFRTLPKPSLAWARFRLPASIATHAALAEFLHRRTASDQRAMVHRLRLLAGNDPRPIAQSVTAPVYHLAGWFDPIVPAPLVRHWLQHHCPGFRGSRTLKTADHSVLLITAEIAARQILAWMQGSRAESRDSLPAP